MNKGRYFRTPTYLVKTARIIAFAALPVLWASLAQASQSNAQFTVFIVLQNDGALCRSSARVGVFGQAVTVVCNSGETVSFSGDTASLPWSSVQDGMYRFVALAPKSFESLGELNNYAGIGTVTSWRVVKLSDLDYLELMIGW